MTASQDAYVIRTFLPSQDEAAYHAARNIRQHVFLTEQSLDAEEEWKQFDARSIHWLLQDIRSGKAIASGRARDITQGCQTKPVVKIEWIAVLAEYRRQGIGSLLIKAMLEDAKQQAYGAAYLQARTDTVGFYEPLGFETEGFEFEEAGVGYYAMRCML